MMMPLLATVADASHPNDRNAEAAVDDAEKAS